MPKRKSEAKPITTEELISKSELKSENIIRLKLTTHKGTRIESVPFKKSEKSQITKLYWKLEEGVVLYGL